MIRFIKKRLLLAIAILALLVGFMYIGKAQDVNAAVLYNEVDSLDVGSIKGGTTTSGDFTFSQATGAYTSKPEFDFVVTGKGDTVTMTYNNTKQYDIRKVRLGVSVSIAYNADFQITKGTTSTTKAITNDNNIEFDVELPSSNNKIVFTFIATEDSPYASINQVQFWVHEITLYEINPQYEATITAGTGVHDVFLSSKTGVTTGDASGTVYSDGTTVYGYARLYGSYKPQSDWTYICKDNSLGKPYYLYQIGSKTINGAAVDFGTINAIMRDPKEITLNNNGGTGSGSIIISANQSRTVDLAGINKDYADFIGWNTKADGSGITYTSTLSTDDIDVLFGDGIETLYAQWVLASNIQDVIGLIDEIGTVTLDSEDKIVAARSAYDALTDGEKTAVSNYQTLTDAEARLAEIKYNNATGDAVRDLIAAIGEVTYPASGDAIDAARGGYDALTNDEQRARVTNYDTLTAAETSYNALMMNGVNAVKDLINAIGAITDPTCLDNISAARDGYDALTKEQKDLVDNYNLLVDAEAGVNARGLINAIGEVTYPASSDAITAARDAYDALTEGQGAYVDNLEVLVLAEDTYEQLKVSGAQNVIVLIMAIGDVMYDNTSKTKIYTAKDAYDLLTAEQKLLVTNYSVLAADIIIYENVDAVYQIIEAINNVKYNSRSKNEINEARALYDSLSEEEKSLVTNYSRLESAENKYSDLKNDHQVFVGWMIALGVIFGILVACGIAYALMFFVFNYFTMVDEKSIRVFKIGKKEEKARLLKMNFMVIYRDENEISKDNK